MPKEYYDYLKIFNKTDSDVLPEAKLNINYRIELNEGRSPEELRFNPLYKISLKESEAYKKYIVENL